MFEFRRPVGRRAQIGPSNVGHAAFIHQLLHETHQPIVVIAKLPAIQQAFRIFDDAAQEGRAALQVREFGSDLEARRTEMTTSHFLLMVLYAFLVSLVFAVLLRDQPREQLKTGAMMFGGFVGVAYVLGWLMYPFPL